MVEYTSNGVFRGRVLISASSSTGGVRDVFYKYKGIKNDLVEFPFGGQIMNPYQGLGKMFAGDLCEYRVDSKAENPKIYLLKTYEAAAASTAKVITLMRDGFRHIPMIGDVLMVAPSAIGGKGKVTTVVAITKKNDTNNKPVWELTVDTALTIAKGDILVEGEAFDSADTDGNTGEMLVKNINAVLPTDFDFCFSPASDPTDTDDFENARYLLTPTMGGVMYKHKMSPIPACVEAVNRVNINGVFGFHAMTMGPND